MSRFRFAVLLLTLAATAVYGPAHADAYPNRQIRLISPFAAGGANDIVSRLLADKLSPELGQQVIVMNKPGAGSVVGSSFLLQSPADGYTVLMAEIAHGANPALRKSLPYDTLKDFAPIVQVAQFPTVLLVNSASPMHSVEDLIAYGKKNPGKLNFSSSGFGTTNHLAAEVFKKAVGIDAVHVPYQGGSEAMNALVSGQVQMLFITLPASMPFIQSGRVRPLAMTSAQRWPALPDVPTLAEKAVPGFSVSLWIGLLAPAGTPAQAISALNQQVNKVLATADFRARITQLGGRVIGGSPQEFDRYIRQEIKRWSQTIQPDMRID